MKKLLFVCALCAATVACGEQKGKPVASSNSATNVAPAVAQRAAKKAPAAKAAKKAPADKAALQARRDARDKAAAEKAGKTLEEYRAEKKSRRDAMMAKRLGMSKEDYAKLTPDEKKAKFSEMMKKYREARAAKKAKAEVTPKPAAAPKAE